MTFDFVKAPVLPMKGDTLLPHDSALCLVFYHHFCSFMPGIPENNSFWMINRTQSLPIPSLYAIKKVTVHDPAKINFPAFLRASEKYAFSWDTTEWAGHVTRQGPVSSDWKGKQRRLEKWMSKRINLYLDPGISM